MALRPTDIQIVIQSTGSVERVQELQQQYSRHQQEQLAVYMQKNLEERKRQTTPLSRVAELEVRPVSREEKREPEREGDPKKRKGKLTKKLGENVDIFI
jgi:hypothetical protein